MNVTNSSTTSIPLSSCSMSAQRAWHHQSLMKENSEGSADRIDPVVAQAGPPHAHDIDPHDRVDSLLDDERRDVFGRCRAAAEER